MGTQAIWCTFAFLIGSVNATVAIIVDETYVYRLHNSNALRNNAAIFALVSPVVVSVLPPGLTTSSSTSD